MIERVAQAIYEHTHKEFRTAAAEVPVPNDKFERVFEELIDCSDRAAAILIFALIDDLFVFYYSRYLNPDVKGGMSSVFDGFGFLSTSHARITLGFLLHWIDKKTYSSILVLKNIRNLFAHHTDIRSFDDRRIMGMINSLGRPELPMLTELEKTVTLSKPTSRRLFIVRSVLLAVFLTNELIYLKHSHDFRVHAGVDWEDLSDGLRRLHMLSAQFCGKVFGVA